MTDSPETGDSPRDVVQVEVWADLVCPWCFIGKRRLQRVLAEHGLTDRVQVIHRAFQLDPGAGSVSMPVVDHLAAKYGVTREEALSMMDDVTEAAAAEGLDYHLELTTTGNTRDAHRLVLSVQERDPVLAQELLGDLYSAYFERGEPIFTAAELIPFAVARGMTADSVSTLLAGDAFVGAVADDQSAARELGANGVPFFVFDGRVGLSGAQPAAVFEAALTQAGIGEAGAHG